MSGVGIIIPVVPSHIGRLGLAGASTEQVALHVSLLAAGYASMQLLLAPLWGRLSDSLGRRPLLAIGLIGFAVGQALCGLATSLLTLYAIRLGTGIFSAAIIPAAFAFVADTTSDEDRTRGMAQLSAAAGSGKDKRSWEAGGVGARVGPWRGSGGAVGGSASGSGRWMRVKKASAAAVAALWAQRTLARGEASEAVGPVSVDGHAR
jgi:MFS family permease